MNFQRRRIKLQRTIQYSKMESRSLTCKIADQQHVSINLRPACCKTMHQVCSNSPFSLSFQQTFSTTRISGPTSFLSLLRELRQDILLRSPHNHGNKHRRFKIYKHGDLKNKSATGSKWLARYMLISLKTCIMWS